MENGKLIPKLNDKSFNTNQIFVHLCFNFKNNDVDI